MIQKPKGTNDIINDQRIVYILDVISQVMDKYNLLKHSPDVKVVYFTELLAEALGVKEDINE